MNKGGFMEEVTLQQRQELGKRRKQERGQHLQGKPSPRGWGHILGGTRGTQPPKGLCWAERVVEVPDLSEPRSLWSKGGNKQAYHGTEWQDFE